MCFESGWLGSFGFFESVLEVVFSVFLRVFFLRMCPVFFFFFLFLVLLADVYLFTTSFAALYVLFSSLGALLF